MSHRQHGNGTGHSTVELSGGHRRNKQEHGSCCVALSRLDSHQPRWVMTQNHNNSSNLPAGGPGESKVSTAVRDPRHSTPADRQEKGSPPLEEVDRDTAQPRSRADALDDDQEARAHHPGRWFLVWSKLTPTGPTATERIDQGNNCVDCRSARGLVTEAREEPRLLRLFTAMRRQKPVGDRLAREATPVKERNNQVKHCCQLGTRAAVPSPYPEPRQLRNEVEEGKRGRRSGDQRRGSQGR